ncbi:MAG: hypothetical protein JEY99_05585 [Spirochaetales bacterium]|nr:hypothetical protein [Spirochaetales bacterium]
MEKINSKVHPDLDKLQRNTIDYIESLDFSKTDPKEVGSWIAGMISYGVMKGTCGNEYGDQILAYTCRYLNNGLDRMGIVCEE